MFTRVVWDMIKNSGSDWEEVGTKHEIETPVEVVEVKKPEEVKKPVEELRAVVIIPEKKAVAAEKSNKKVIPLDMSMAELRKALKKKGVKIPPTPSKKALIQLYNDN